VKPLKPSLYDPLKFFTQVVLPAFGTLYFALAGIWGLPSADEVVGTVVAVDAFLGVVLQISSTAYKAGDNFDGTMNIHEDETGKKTFALHLDSDPHNLEHLDKITFNVKKNQ
jgi:hypothetical protein